MIRKWYQVFVEKLNYSYENTYILLDQNGIIELAEVQNFLNEQQIFVHRFKSELSLRQSLKQHGAGVNLIALESESQFKILPFDIRESYPYIHWNLLELFPDWDPQALSLIPGSWLPLLYPLSQQSWLRGRKLSSQDTLDLAIRFILQLPFHDKLSPAKQLYACLRMLEEFSEFPEWFSNWLNMHSLMNNVVLPIQMKKEHFHSWLQDIWAKHCMELPVKDAMVFDFSDPLLNANMQKLFANGTLKQFSAIPFSKELKSYFDQNPWMAIGLDIEKKESYQHLTTQLFQQLQTELESGCPDWVKLVELKSRMDFYCSYFDINPLIEDKDIEIIDRAFVQWIEKEYSNLWFRSFKEQPWVIHQVLPHLKELKENKIALICFDGMSYQEWYVIERYLKEHYIHQFKVKGIFAWIPTLTSISRKALFAGLPNTVEQSNEEKLFKDFWINDAHKLTDAKLFKHQKLQWTEDFLYHSLTGIIYNTVDDLAHSDQYTGFTKRTMLANLFENLYQSNFHVTIKQLLANQYRVFITSDHGTIKAVGNGLEESRYLLDDKSKRALIYPNQTLAENKLSLHDKSTLWMFKNDHTLGEKVALLPMGRDMFASKNTAQITHGGCTIDEVIVPFVEVLP